MFVSKIPIDGFCHFNVIVAKVVEEEDCLQFLAGLYKLIVSMFLSFLAIVLFGQLAT